MVTPLEPRAFFRGTWVGEGELRPHPLVRWFAPVERVRMTSTATWLSETVWEVGDRFEFSSGRLLERTMSCELVAPNRVRVTADDLPGGTEIELYERGFRFAPYTLLVEHRGLRLSLRCFDACTLDEQGRIHDRIRMRFLGIPVATLRIGPIYRDLPRSR